MKYLENLAIASLAVFAPAKSALLAVLALCLADMVFGIIAARRTGAPVTSRGLKRTIVKILVYEAALLCAFLTGQYLIGELIPVMKLVAGLVGVTELKSILENLSTIQGSPLLTKAVTKLEEQLNPEDTLTKK